MTDEYAGNVTQSFSLEEDHGFGEPEERQLNRIEPSSLIQMPGLVTPLKRQDQE